MVNKETLFQVAEVKLSYSTKIKSSERMKVASSHEVYNVFKSVWDVGTIELIEEFKVMLLNRSNKVLGIINLASGGMASCVIDPKLIFVSAIKSGASAVILAHNHPSGNTKPSDQDRALTKKIKDGGKLLDIEVLDHLIMTKEGFLSFADEGLM